MKIKAKCQYCGETYWKTNGKSKYCSDACKKAVIKDKQRQWREDHPSYSKEWFEAHPDYRAQFLERHPHYDRDRSRKIRGYYSGDKRQCIVCGKTFTATTALKVVCSEDCRIKHETARKALIRREIDDEQIVNKDINLKMLYRRDNGICYLCGGLCDWNDKNGLRMGLTYPSIDHVIPLAKGGLHSWDNVRLAHISCNCRKSDRIITR